MSSTDELVNPYELLELPVEATEQEIKTAYRQRSLKVHPDRNRNNPDAARKFHELNQAYELLLDPLRRLAIDAKIRLKQAQQARVGKFSAKRKEMLAQLEEREVEFKKQRMDKQKEEVSRWHETERIKEEGRKLREEREKAMLEREKEQESAEQQGEDDLAAPELGPLDTTVRLQYTLIAQPTLTTPDSISILLAPFGSFDTPVLRLKPSKKAKAATTSDPNAKPPPMKFATSLVPFKQIGDAFAAVCASGKKVRGLEGIEVTWAGGSEPPILEWLRKLGKLGGYGEGSGSSAQPSEGGEKAELPQLQTKGDAAFSSFPTTLATPRAAPEPSLTAPVGGIDYESLTLMRMRQAERERLEREIREQEGDD